MYLVEIISYKMKFDLSQVYLHYMASGDFEFESCVFHLWDRFLNLAFRIILKDQIESITYMYCCAQQLTLAPSRRTKAVEMKTLAPSRRTKVVEIT